MLKQFLNHLRRENLEIEDKSVLLAISGGKDSMVMIDLFMSAKIKIAVAHINHCLRGDESEGDALFIRSFCAERGIAFYEKIIDVKSLAESQGVNMHAVARKARYDFFNHVLYKEQYDYIATAHHRNDAMESILINLAKGTGLKGLSGIAIKKDTLIRPLLFCNRKEIDHYAEANNLSYREDSSNTNYHYLRNRVRHLILPTMENIFPSLYESGNRTIENVNDARLLLDDFLAKWQTANCYEKEGITYIPKSELGKIPGIATLLFYLLKPKGYTRDQCHQLSRSLDHIGANFYAGDYRLLVDRKHLVLSGVIEIAEKRIDISIGNNDIGNGMRLLVEQVSHWNPSQNSLEGFFDADKLKFPLTYRNWSDGDRFSPLGMSGKSQKIKDYLINNKIDQLRKKTTFVLESENEICWLVGHRISESFKVEEISTDIVRVQLISR